MEEMRLAAMAHYANMSDKKQKEAMKFFNSIEKSGDGAVSTKEFLDFIRKKGFEIELPQNVFKLLDENNNGTLSFEECVTFFYMIKYKKFAFCKGCGIYLSGIRFVCVKCYKADKEKTYDLCCSCYRNKNHSHAHTKFLDNDALHRQKRAKLGKTLNVAFKVLGATATIHGLML
ncbi:hypothetical protein Vadar_023956 [Vaccinium darrowii]|uniref:Uncharacterized protein n=1 Tax=Vaccinium darrowii TaxID=229202 RepID=A0ACB7YYD5_9ERIC|nr:hypothetical protein Vadar_023956 [Vaccinium darrowii]